MRTQLDFIRKCVASYVVIEPGVGSGDAGAIVHPVNPEMIPDLHAEGLWPARFAGALAPDRGTSKGWGATGDGGGGDGGGGDGGDGIGGDIYAEMELGGSGNPNHYRPSDSYSSSGSADE
jgi:hypothetical protein